MSQFVIGICGGTGSGKTTLAKRIVKALGDERAILINMDSYYKDNSHMEYLERCKINYDHPNAFDMDLLLEQLIALKNGEDIDSPVYDFTVHNRAPYTERIQSKPIIVIEGILLFTEPKIVEQLDMKIFVDTDADVRILRRILRDVKERERSLDSVVNQYLTTVKPMHETFIEPNKKYADIIVPEGGENEMAYRMILESLKNK